MEPIKKLKTKENLAQKKEWKWNQVEDGLVWGKTSDFVGSSDVAMFDMDGNLITTLRGSGFPKDAHDWKFLNSQVIPKLKKYSDKGYAIVIISNQNGISSNKTTCEDIMTKITEFSQEFCFPVAALFATQDDNYRKPLTGMFKYFKRNLNDGEEINIKNAFFVGDAAGRRRSAARRRNDHSSSDRLFALNCGVKFFTPEAFFLGEGEKLPKIGKTVYEKFKKNKTPFVGDEYTFDADEKHVVFFIGSPGSGKSTLWKQFMSDYARVNNDAQKSKSKSKKVFLAGVEEGKGIVIDNTNCTKLQRSIYIALADEHKYKKIAFRFNLSKEDSFVFNKLRRINPHRTHISKRVTKIPIHTFFKNIEEPTLEEFDEIYEVQPVLNFESKKEKKFLKMNL